MNNYFLQYSVIFLALLGASSLKAHEVEIEPTPINLVDFTCFDFSQKAQACEKYTCQTPYYLDPTVTTEWQITGKNNNRCVITSTTADIGLKDDNDMPKPVTKTCEYDETGIRVLGERMNDMKQGYFELPSENTKGVFNCTFTSNGQPLEEAPAPMLPDDE